MAKVEQITEPEELAKEEHEAEQAKEKAEAPEPKPKKSKQQPAYIDCKQKVLMDAVSVMDGLLHEVILNIDENGLTATEMDQANIAMYVLDLKPGVFNEIEGKAKVRVQVKALKGMLKRAKPDDNVRITFSNPIELVFASKFNKTFILPQIDIEVDKVQKLPTMEHTAIFKIKTELLIEAVDDSGEVADSLTFGVKNNKLSISAKGDMSGYSGEVATIEGVEGIACQSKYAREYMTKIVKKISPEVTVKLASDYPIILEYDLGNESKLTLLLAPRVETD